MNKSPRDERTFARASEDSGVRLNDCWSPVGFFISDESGRDEFSSVIDWLTNSMSLSIFECVAGAVESSSAKDPQLIVLGQSYRGEFSEEHVLQLRKRFPIVRIICVLGAWSEGETRSGTPMPGVERWYAHQFVDQMISETEMNGAMTLPVTASNEERWLALASSGRRPDLSVDSIVIVSRDLSLAEAISKTCQALGWRSVFVFPDAKMPAREASVVIYDADPDSSRRVDEVRRINKEMPQARILALMDFSRTEERRQIIDAGATEVMSKPFPIEHLGVRLRTMTSSDSDVQNSELGVTVSMGVKPSSR